MRVVYVARDPIDAQMAQAILAKAGIDAVVKEAVAGVTTDVYPSVVVLRDPDAERARRVLDREVNG